MKTVEFLKDNIWLIGIILLATILRLYHLGHQSAWADEISTLSNTNPNSSFRTVITDVNLKEGFPYIYFLIMKVLHAISYSNLTGRIFSAVVGIASVYWIFKLGKVLYDKKAGYIAAILLALNQFAILISQDARPYALYMLFTVISFYYLAIYIKNPTTKNAIFYGLAAGLLLNTSFYGILNVGSQGIILIFYWLFVSKEFKFAYFKNLLIAAAIGFVFFIPNYFKLTTLLGFQSGWIAPPTNESVGMIFNEFLGHSNIINFICLLLIIFFMVKLFSEKNLKSYEELITNKITFGFTILLPWLLLFLIVMYIKSYLETSVLLHRYFISLLPLLILVFAASISFISSRIVQYATIATLSIFMLVNLFVVHNFYQRPRNTEYRHLTEYVINKNTDDNPVYTNLSIWLNNLAMVDEKKIELTQIESLEKLVSDMETDSSKIKSFWYINADMGAFIMTPETQSYLETHFDIVESFDGYNVYAREFKSK